VSFLDQELALLLASIQVEVLPLALVLAWASEEGPQSPIPSTSQDIRSR
jgi:hypothetical protein